MMGIYNEVNHLYPLFDLNLLPEIDREALFLYIEIK